MRRIRNFSGVFFAALFLLSTTGCASLRQRSYSEAPAGQIFFAPVPSSEEAFSLSRFSGSVTERQKIDYLLDRIAASDYRFIRNGELHDGKTARRWFLYKMVHWVDRVETAQDFVIRVASHSQKTGKPYLVEFPDGKIYSVASVLRNELFFFESSLTKLHQVTRSPIPQPGQVTISPTAVAATAVATSTS